MSDMHVVAFYREQALWMNLLYALVAMCVAYKLAFVTRQAALIAIWPVRLLRFCAVVVGTLILFKAAHRLSGGDTATWWDIARELGWCGFLLSLIVLMREKVGRYCFSLAGLSFAVWWVLSSGQALADDIPRGLGHPKPGQSHFYEVYCCNNQDCEPLPPGAVRMVEGGYRVRYLSSQGNIIEGFVSFEDARQSKDGQDHGCDYKGHLRCLYVASNV